jgi:hypothetical protein
MDAKVAVLESNVSKLTGDARVKAETALADVRTKRDAFAVMVKKEGESAGPALTSSRAELESHVSAFEASAKKAMPQADGETKAGGDTK